MGAHTLHDSAIVGKLEVCGLCARPSPMCQIFLKKGRGENRGVGVDLERSSCPNLLRFRYASASQYKKNSPCTNVPMICPLCPAKSIAVWKYCLPQHFKDRHNLAPSKFPVNVELSQLELDAMSAVWKHRHKHVKKRRSRKKKNTPLVLSEAHSSRVAFRYATFTADGIH